MKTISSMSLIVKIISMIFMQKNIKILTVFWMKKLLLNINVPRMKKKLPAKTSQLIYKT